MRMGCTTHIQWLTRIISVFVGKFSIEVQKFEGFQAL